MTLPRIGRIDPFKLGVLLFGLTCGRVVSELLLKGEWFYLVPLVAGFGFGWNFDSIMRRLFK